METSLQTSCALPQSTATSDWFCAMAIDNLDDDFGAQDNRSFTLDGIRTYGQRMSHLKTSRPSYVDDHYALSVLL